MLKRKGLWLFAILVGVNLLIGNRLYSTVNPPAETTGDIYKKLDLFTDVLAIVQKSYVEPVNSKDLMYGALKGMLDSLDPHSQFMDPDMYKEMQVETEGEFGGLGIEITIRDKWLTVVTPIPGTPAFEAGLQPGDRIVKIDKESTEDITLIAAVKRLRGKPGSAVQLTIMRIGKGELLEFSMKRAIIKLESIKDAQMIAPNIGYIRITQFQEHTTEDLKNTLKELDSKGMKGLVLDLRNNPGGLLLEAIKVSEQFIQNKLIVYTKGRLTEQNVEYKSQNSSPYSELPMVVLLNGGSASGSEIVAGAVQDYRRGILLGTKSFGKGSVQSVLPLKDGSAVRLTTAKYFTPKGRSIHGEGILPDIVVEISEEDEVKLRLSKSKRLEKLEKQEKQEKEEKPEQKSTEEKLKEGMGKPKEEKEPEVRDVQLDRAVDLLKGLQILSSKGAILPMPAALPISEMKPETPKSKEKSGGKPTDKK